jgi:hypothetical protein
MINRNIARLVKILESAKKGVVSGQFGAVQNVFDPLVYDLPNLKQDKKKQINTPLPERRMGMFNAISKKTEMAAKEIIVKEPMRRDLRKLNTSRRKAQEEHEKAVEWEKEVK